MQPNQSGSMAPVADFLAPLFSYYDATPLAHCAPGLQVFRNAVYEKTVRCEAFAVFKSHNSHAFDGRAGGFTLAVSRTARSGLFYNVLQFRLLRVAEHVGSASLLSHISSSSSDPFPPWLCSPSRWVISVIPRGSVDLSVRQMHRCFASHIFQLWSSPLSIMIATLLSRIFSSSPRHTTQFPRVSLDGSLVLSTKTDSDVQSDTSKCRGRHYATIEITWPFVISLVCTSCVLRPFPTFS